MYTLPGNLTIYHVEEIQADLLDHIKTGSGEIVLDGKNVKDIDGCGLQLLLSFYKSCSQEGINIQMINCNKTIHHLLTISGAADILYQN